MLPLKKILCPTDFSEFASEAVRKAADLAAQFNAELCLLHVCEPVQITYGLVPFSSAVDTGAYEQESHDAAEREIEELGRSCGAAKIAVRPLLRRGAAADEIVAAAQEEDADMIVIATHGVTGWRQSIFGSVAEKVLRLSPCPVLTVRGAATVLGAGTVREAGADS